jgi:recombinational DNA repair protein RecT
MKQQEKQPTTLGELMTEGKTAKDILQYLIPSINEIGAFDKKKAAQIAATATKLIWEGVSNDKTAFAWKKVSLLSLSAAIVQVGLMGFSLDVQFGQAYLVPQGDKITLQIGYQGYLAKLKEQGCIIDAYAVSTHHTWGGYVAGERPIHKVKDFSKQVKEEDLVCVWLEVKHVIKGVVVKSYPMPTSKSYIVQCKKVAKTDSIWNTWFERMALKTALKAYCKHAAWTAEIEGLQIDGAAIVGMKDGEVEYEYETYEDDKLSEEDFAEIEKRLECIPSEIKTQEQFDISFDAMIGFASDFKNEIEIYKEVEQLFSKKRAIVSNARIAGFARSVAQIAQFTLDSCRMELDKIGSIDELNSYHLEVSKRVPIEIAPEFDKLFAEVSKKLKGGQNG